MWILLSGVLYSTLNPVSAAAAAIHPSPPAFKKARDEYRPAATVHKHPGRRVLFSFEEPKWKARYPTMPQSIANNCHPVPQHAACAGNPADSARCSRLCSKRTKRLTERLRPAFDSSRRQWRICLRIQSWFQPCRQRLRRDSADL